MTNNKDIWISGALSSGELSNKLGIRAKYFGHDWEAPTHIVPPKPDEVFKNVQRHARGATLEREDFPEACYVFDPKSFRRAKDFFFLGSFAAVKGRLAEVLEDADLGSGGLVQVPVFDMDKKTELKGPFYALNFGTREGMFVPEQSKNIHPILRQEVDRKDLWRSYAEADGEIAVSAKALEEGPDLWVDPRLKSKIFLSGSLVKAIRQAKI